MATGYRKCRVCGESYRYCKTNLETGLFRWQDVACSPEHGAVYFEQIAISRGAAIPDVAINDFPEDESFDALFEEDFDDGEEEIEIEK